MLSYRHGFHAGNHADVLKHIVLAESLSSMLKKDAALLYVDTHAGAGLYRLREGYAAMNEEWAGGIARLRAAASSPPRAIADYLSLVASFAAADDDAYPGSPAIAMRMLRPSDRASLYELHPSDYEPLSAAFEDDERVMVRKADGFSALPGQLPPQSRRGLVLVDPSYELSADYDAVVAAVSGAIRRFSTGVYIIWYPLLERDEAKRLPDRLLGLVSQDKRSASSAIDLRLRIRSSAHGERGMSGSGLVVLNPPWLLKEAMEEALPYLVTALGEGPGAAGSVEVR